MPGHTRSTLYAVRIRRILSQSLLTAFPSLRAETKNRETLLGGALPDLAALYGFLGEIEALGLELPEVRHELPPPQAGRAHPEPA